MGFSVFLLKISLILFMLLEISSLAEFSNDELCFKTYFMKSLTRNASLETLCDDDQLLGKRLEQYLTKSRKTAEADLNTTVETSEFIADEIWDRMGSDFSKNILLNDIQLLSASDQISCRSDICTTRGYAEYRCKCEPCNKIDEYSDGMGAASCKKCRRRGLGTFSSSKWPYYNWACQECSVGHYGVGDGRCHLCDGPMEYTDTNLATECKKCPVGSVAEGKSRRYHTGN